jgi:endonuclease/exonuclease/phosphatase family metal-dependent hydrolase
MQQEIRFATFNVRNLALPGIKFYEDQLPYSPSEYDAKINWIARQLDQLDADVIGFQEIFSQAALKQVLARTQKYRQAHHAGIDPDPQRERLTPSVALVSRLPIAADATIYANFPRDLSVALPGVANRFADFTRPVLRAGVILTPALTVNVFVCHLKSKRPDFRNGGNGDDSDQLGIAILRSLIRRSTEALGLRYLLTDYANGRRIPLVVMGDFNDVAGAVSTQLVMGVARPHKNGCDSILFDSHVIQSRHDPSRGGAYTRMHEANFETVDHILVSEEFHPASRFSVGEVQEVIYLNDHVALQPLETSDHGVVLARIRLSDATSGATAPESPPLPPL